VPINDAVFAAFSSANRRNDRRTRVSSPGPDQVEP
jgi:hypothetical protein